MLKKLALVALALFCILAPKESQAKGGPFGLGIILGEPTGITGKYFFSKDEALDFHLGLEGFDGGRHDNVGFYVDYLFHFDLGVNNSVMSMPLYVGPGGALIITDNDYCGRFKCYRDNDDSIWLAIRAPVGLSFQFKSFPGEAFIEIIPHLFFIQHIDFDLDLALGFRFYF